MSFLSIKVKLTKIRETYIRWFSYVLYRITDSPTPKKKKVICAKWKNMKQGKDNMKITGVEAMKTDLITQKCFQISKFENRQ